MRRVEIAEENPYSSRLLNYLDYLAIQGMRVFKVPMDITVSCLYMTTPEKERWYLYIHRMIIIFPIGFLLMVLTMPINILAFGLWLMIHTKRKPYRLSYCSAPNQTTRVKATYGFVTTNVCLMPECMSRFNNFSGSWHRAERMGEIMARTYVDPPSHVIDIEDDPDSVQALNNDSQNPLLSTTDHNMNEHQSFAHSKSCPSLGDDGHMSMPSIHGGHHCASGAPKLPNFDVSVLDFMPDADFILLQEASWDMEYAKTLVRKLHAQYPYVVYDIGVHSFKGNLYVGNSGLMLASKYNILDIRFGLFMAAASPCWFASKGLLQLKVYLGRSSAGNDVVGYVFNTHLQAYKRDRPIQTEQMDDILQWTADFRRETHKPGEIVAFDILGGDFNLDNMSPADKESYTHPLFNTYIDIGRERLGKDHDWTKGTELRQILLYDPHLSSPAALRRVLEDPLLMQTYLLDGDITYSSLEMASSLAKRDKQGRVIPSNVGGKRRIDYLLYNQRDKHIAVTSFNPVTALHSLTDHIPMYLSVSICRHPELREQLLPEMLS